VADTPQTFANHRHRDRLWLLTALCAVVAFALTVLLLLRVPGSINALALLLITLSVLGLTVMIRRYATRLQDRIIRLEMRIRLAALGRAADVDRLTVRQLVALRFASDAEIGPLLDRAISENLTPDQIKRAVTNWQADRLRT
jgi:hypothetical protein